MVAKESDVSLSPLGEAMERAGYKNSEIADVLGVSAQRVNNWRRGHSRVPAQYVGIICSTLGVEPDEINAWEPDHGGEGGRLCRWRTERGWSAPHLALILGVSADTVWNWERNEVSPLPENIQSLAAIGFNWSAL